jgi:hypothetical protein
MYFQIKTILMKCWGAVVMTKLPLSFSTWHIHFLQFSSLHFSPFVLLASLNADANFKPSFSHFIFNFIFSLYIHIFFLFSLTISLCFLHISFLLHNHYLFFLITNGNVFFFRYINVHISPTIWWENKSRVWFW